MPDPGCEPPADDIELPELHEAVLDDETLGTLFADLELMGNVLEVRTKGGGADNSRRGLDLAAARQALMERQVGAVQICYRYKEQLWIDTLLRGSDGVRLVRIRGMSNDHEQSG